MWPESEHLKRSAASWYYCLMWSFVNDLLIAAIVVNMMNMFDQCMCKSIQICIYNAFIVCRVIRCLIHVSKCNLRLRIGLVSITREKNGNTWSNMGNFGATLTNKRGFTTLIISGQSVYYVHSEPVHRGKLDCSSRVSFLKTKVFVSVQ